MEKISAAYAMEWSIELEKGIRSKKPGRALEAILQIGPRLLQWNREPGLTPVEYNIFGLIPGEDILFASTILLRVADVFRSGDKNLRACIVRVFLSMRRHSGGRNGEQKNEILSNQKMRNQKELFQRIKTVFSTGDVESRALALVLFGCWADLAIGSVDIQYLLLSGLVSCDDFEVSASLFSAGCFCALSDDFASVILEMLVKIVASSKVSPSVRLAGTGVKLVLGSLEEDILVAMLKPLSKVASQLTHLTSEQVDLLFKFFTPEASLHLKVMTLKCLCFLFRKRAYQSPNSAFFIKSLFSMLDAPELPLTSQWDALQILHEILIYNSFSPPCPDLLEVSKLLQISGNADQFPIISMRILAIRVLVSISDIFGGGKMGPCGAFGTPLQLQIVSVVFDRIFSLVKFALGFHQTDSEMEKECRSLLKLLLLLVKHYPDSGLLAMDKIDISMECLVKVVESAAGTRERVLLTNVIEKLLFYVYKFVMACLEICGQLHASDAQMLYKAKSVAEHVCCCSLFACYTRAIYSLLLHHVRNREKDAFLFNGGGSCASPGNCMAEQEAVTLECANELLAHRLNWSAYGAGRYAACHGAWCTAALIFGELITVIESDSFRFWLKCLSQFCHSEMELRLLFWINGPIFETSNIFLMPCSDRPSALSINLLSCSEKLAGVCSIVYSSTEALGRTSDQTFCFQKWLLSLRENVLETIQDVLKLLSNLPWNPVFIGKHGQVGGVLNDFAQISFRWKRLAQEHDLIARAFIDMDRKSSKILLAVALSCSLLAFCTGFALCIPSAPCSNVVARGAEKLETNLSEMLVRDLIDRLCYFNSENSVDLRLLLCIIGQHMNYTSVSENEIPGVGCEASDILSVCSSAVRGFVRLQNDADLVHDDERLSRSFKGCKILFDVMGKLMHIPFRIPGYFFRVRSRVAGSELFAFGKNRGGEQDGITVALGSHLSLDLCLQLKNMDAYWVNHPTKLYCILHFSQSFQIPEPSIGGGKGQSPLGFRAWAASNAVELNARLFAFVTKCAEGGSGGCGDAAADWGGAAYVRLRQNGRGQGFGTCLLDVSSFTAGSYGIRWHGCFIDDQGHYRSLLPLNDGPVFTVRNFIDC